MIDWEKYNRSQAAISGLGFVEVDIKDYEKMRAALQPVILEQPDSEGWWWVDPYGEWKCVLLEYAEDEGLGWVDYEEGYFQPASDFNKWVKLPNHFELP